MDERTLERAGAFAGIAFVVLGLLSGFIYPQQPRVDSAPAVTLAWVHSNRTSIQLGMILGLFGAAALLWFVGHLRHILDRAEGGAEALSPIVYGAGIAVAVVSALSTLPSLLLAYMDAQPGGIQDPTVVRMLGDLNTVMFAVASVMTAVFLLALGVAMVRKEMVAPWLGWLTLVVAALNAVSVWVGATFSSYHGSVWNPVAWGAFLGLLVVVLLLSVAMLTRKAEREVVTVS